jgi:hypothetical protein
MHHAIDQYRRSMAVGFDYLAALAALLTPRAATDWIELFGIVVFGLLMGLTVAATAAARHRRAK